MISQHVVGAGPVGRNEQRRGTVTQKCLRQLLRISAASMSRTFVVQARGSGREVLNMYVS
jgi:hypothetical protein